METKEYFVQLDSLMPLFRECLEQGQNVKFSPRGTSMMPMLRQGKDSVTLSPVPARLKKYDLPLYQRDDGSYILHRVIASGETYTCMGDNQFLKETDLRHEQMIALVTAFTRGQREYSIDHLGYRIYCWFWSYSRPVRYFLHRSIRWLRRHLW